MKTLPSLTLLPCIDDLIAAADNALRTLASPAQARRPLPVAASSSPLQPEQARHAAGLMRVNHSGEICAQALYMGQALATQDAVLQEHLLHAAQEETDHLAWTEQRLKTLGSRTSLLNPLWYAGAFTIGFFAGKIGGDQASLGFVVETENQVEAHLQSHLDALPAEDYASRAIVAQMKADEMRHARQAQEAGAMDLPRAITSAMRMAAKIMTTLAYRL